MTAQRSLDGDSKDCFNSKKNSTTEGVASSGMGRIVAINDAELSRQVIDALRETQEQALCELQVLTQLGVITLQGQVPTKLLKLLAIRTALSVGGGWCVVNCAGICVSPSAEAN